MKCSEVGSREWKSFTVFKKCKISYVAPLQDGHFIGVCDALKSSDKDLSH